MPQLAVVPRADTWSEDKLHRTLQLTPAGVTLVEVDERTALIRDADGTWRTAGVGHVSVWLDGAEADLERAAGLTASTRAIIRFVSWSRPTSGVPSSAARRSRPNAARVGSSNPRDVARVCSRRNTFSAGSVARTRTSRTTAGSKRPEPASPSATDGGVPCFHARSPPTWRTHTPRSVVPTGSS